MPSPVFSPGSVRPKSIVFGATGSFEPCTLVNGLKVRLTGLLELLPMPAGSPDVTLPSTWAWTSATEKLNARVMPAMPSP